jgi:hypothetical protein
MARKTRKSTTEQLASRICGLKPNGDTIMIHVYKKGRSVRLSSGMSGSHLVHPSNEGSSEGWMREARLVWNLTDMYDEHPVYTNDEQSRERFKALQVKGEKINAAKKDT